MYQRKFKLCMAAGAAAAAAGSGAAGAGAAGAGSIGAGVGAAAGSGALGTGSAGAGAGLGQVMSGASGLLGFGLGLASLITQARANKQARKDQMYFYEDQKKWQSPAYQMYLRNIAGLNPYGDFQTGSVGQPTPVNLAGGVTEASGLMADSLSQSTAHYIDSLSQKLLVKQLELENKRVQNDTKLADANAKLLDNKSIYQALLNYITEQTSGNTITMSYADVENALQEIVSRTRNNEWLDTLNFANLGKTLAETAGIKYNTDEYLPAMLLLAQMNGQSQRDLNDTIQNLNKQQEKNLEETLENLKIQGAGVKEFKKMIDNMPDGFGKSFMTALLIVLQSNLKKP